jgi:hypothetical protein
MKRILVTLLFAGLSMAPAQEKGKSAAPNMLTSQEQQQGFKLLFDGKTIDGWTGFGNSQWKVEDGAITADGRGGWLATKGDYQDFILKVDFRTSAPNINSGVFLRRGRDSGDSHQIGYELQIRNPDPKDKGYDGKVDNHNGYYTGSFSGHLKSHNEPTITMGEWHHFEVTAQGDHFIVTYDGKKVLDDRHPQFKSGAIGLQNTGQKIEFRNIKVKPL